MHLGVFSHIFSVANIMHLHDWNLAQTSFSSLSSSRLPPPPSPTLPLSASLVCLVGQEAKAGLLVAGDSRQSCFYSARISS